MYKRQAFKLRTCIHVLGIFRGAEQTDGRKDITVPGLIHRKTKLRFLVRDQLFGRRLRRGLHSGGFGRCRRGFEPQFWNGDGKRRLFSLWSRGLAIQRDVKGGTLTALFFGFFRFQMCIRDSCYAIGIQPGEQVQHGGIAGDHGGAQIGKGFPTGGKRVRRLLPDLLYNGGLKRFQPVFVAVIDAGNHIAAKAALGVHPALDAQQFAIRQIIEISDHSGGANIYSKAAPRFDWRIDGKLRKNGGGLDLAAGIAGDVYKRQGQPILPRPMRNTRQTVKRRALRRIRRFKLLSVKGKDSDEICISHYGGF